jgi:hypothetical protein
MYARRWVAAVSVALVAALAVSASGRQGFSPGPEPPGPRGDFVRAGGSLFNRSRIDAVMPQGEGGAVVYLRGWDRPIRLVAPAFDELSQALGLGNGPQAPPSVPMPPGVPPPSGEPHSIEPGSRSRPPLELESGPSELRPIDSQPEAEPK